MEELYITLYGDTQITYPDTAEKHKKSDFEDRKDYYARKAVHKSETEKKNIDFAKAVVRHEMIEQGWKLDEESLFAISIIICKDIEGKDIPYKTFSKEKQEEFSHRNIPYGTPAITRVQKVMTSAMQGQVFKYIYQIVGIQISRVYSDCDRVEVVVTKVNDRGDVEDAFKEGIEASKELASK